MTLRRLIVEPRERTLSSLHTLANTRLAKESHLENSNDPEGSALDFGGNGHGRPQGIER
jgi:hypothetical protein